MTNPNYHTRTKACNILNQVPSSFYHRGVSFKTFDNSHAWGWGNELHEETYWRPEWVMLPTYNIQEIRKIVTIR